MDIKKIDATIKAAIGCKELVAKSIDYYLSDRLAAISKIVNSPGVVDLANLQCELKRLNAYEDGAHCMIKYAKGLLKCIEVLIECGNETINREQSATTEELEEMSV